MMYRIATAVLFVLSFPLQLVVGVIIALSSGFPVIFAQKRVGKGGAIFTMYKFRTMVKNAEVLKAHYRTRNESDGPTFKIQDDPRFTAIGKLLSHTGLDELPQLWNVLRGEMALIGPRPLPVSEAKRLTPWMRNRHTILPGVISPAILNGNYHKNFVGWMKSDIAYARHKNAWGDAALFLRLLPFGVKLLWYGIWDTLW